MRNDALDASQGEYVYRMPRFTLLTPYVAAAVVLATAAVNEHAWLGAIAIVPVLIAWLFACPGPSLVDLFPSVAVVSIVLICGVVLADTIWFVAAAASFTSYLGTSAEAAARTSPIGRVDKHGIIKPLTKEEYIQAQGVLRNRGRQRVLRV